MAETFLDGRVVLHAGDCIAACRSMPAESVDAIVTDPPYHLASIVKRFGKKGSAAAKSNGATGVYRRAARGFMGKEWDGGDVAHNPETWAAIGRVLKPGGHLVAFHATKNWHLLTLAIETAGFEIRDHICNLWSWSEHALCFVDSLTPGQAEALARLIDAGDPLADLFWIYGSGFPKGLDISKAIDRALGAGARGAPVRQGVSFGVEYERSDKGEPITEQAQRWGGWNVALKPAFEPIVLARKPLSEKSVAANIMAHGTGGINVAGCLIKAPDAVATEYTVKRLKPGATLEKTGGNWRPEEGGEDYSGKTRDGRWPANVVHDGSAEVVDGFPNDKGRPGIRRALGKNDPAVALNVYAGGWRDHVRDRAERHFDDIGSCARFFYSAKADAHDRIGSRHPTIKPINLLRWLVRLVTSPGGTILDPFAGTGTTAEAAYAEGFSAVLVEREPDYLDDIRRRMDLLRSGPATRKTESAKARRGIKSTDDLPLFGDGTAPGDAGDATRDGAGRSARSGSNGEE